MGVLYNILSLSKYRSIKDRNLFLFIFLHQKKCLPEAKIVKGGSWDYLRWYFSRLLIVCVFFPNWNNMAQRKSQKLFLALHKGFKMWPRSFWVWEHLANCQPRSWLYVFHLSYIRVIWWISSRNCRKFWDYICWKYQQK